MKKLILMTGLVLCFSFAMLAISGCAKKKAEAPAEQVAPADTTAAPAADTTAAM